jgi:positive regulator of sigma E activity
VDRAFASRGCTATGIVRASEPGRLDVEIGSPPRCEGCDGACLWYRVPSHERLRLAADAAFPVGATVAVTLPDRYLLLGASLVYGVPLVALLAGGALGSALGGSDLSAAAGALGALVGAVLLAPRLRRRLEAATVRKLAVRLVE